ncbi:hypothetical protein L3Q82_019069, partial [Scortum barcoo]
AIEPTPKIDGRQQAAVTLQENMTHRFNCHSDGWDPRAPPLLTWYLNGMQQEEPSPNRGRLVMTSHGDSEAMRPGASHNSTFSLRARKWDRELVCVASNPRTGESYNATVTLNVQFQPEILRVNAHYSETSDPGLSLVLFALIRSNPPATITFVDQSGQLLANTSDILLLDSRSYPWLTNHSLRVMLTSLSGNVSLNANNSVGTAQSNLTLAEFLQSRVEVPMLGIVTGGAMAFMALLILSLIVLCLMQKNKSKSIGETLVRLCVSAHRGVQCVLDVSPPYSLHSDSTNLKAEKADKTHIPRENMSLPSNMQLNDLSSLRKGTKHEGGINLVLLETISLFPKHYPFKLITFVFCCVRHPSSLLVAREAAQQNSVGERKKEEEEEEDLSLAYAARGFARYPMVGYIYKRRKHTMKWQIIFPAWLLLCTLTDIKIKVKTVSDGIELSCPDSQTIVKSGTVKNLTLPLKYKDENSGEYHCLKPDNDGQHTVAEKIYVKFRSYILDYFLAGHSYFLQSKKAQRGLTLCFLYRFNKLITIYLVIDFALYALHSAFEVNSAAGAICLHVAGVLRVSGMRIYTSGDMEAVNGTDVRLRCTFQSSSPINPDAIVISWSFRPLKPGREESVFHYQQRPYPPVEGIFRKRVAWDGDVMGRDASIIIQQVKFIYNGTYICQVKNPPDVHGVVGEIRLRVVTTASFSELLLLALAIGGGIAVVVLLLVIILSCRRYRKRRQRQREGNEEAPRKERKDPTAW